MLKSKKILFIAPEFFSYSVLIQKELESMGALVSLFSIRPTSLISKLTGLYLLHKYEKIKIKYFKKLLINFEKHYDYILIIRADLLPDDFLPKLIALYPETKFIQYVWDDIDLIPNLSDSFKYFNRVLSYNIFDCEKHKLIFRPFFFVDQKSSDLKTVIRQYEIFFIGSFRADRLALLEKILVKNPQIRFYYHLYINPITFFLNKISLRKRTLFKFHKMKYSEMIKMMNHSIAVLDMQNIFQNGLTTRIFEALGARVKIVTTNRNILDYEFFNSNNILVIDRNNPIIERNWLDTPYEEYDKVLLNKYHINSWISEVFDI